MQVIAVMKFLLIVVIFVQFYYQCFCQNTSVSDKIKDGETNATIERKINLECGGIFTQKQTVLESPNYPSNYPSNQDCSYLIQGPECPTYFVLQFLDFSLEESLGCSKDRLEIENQDALCKKPAGVKTYRSQNGILVLKFVSNGQGSGRGFRILVTRLPCNSDDPENSSRIPKELDGGVNDLLPPPTMSTTATTFTTMNSFTPSINNLTPVTNNFSPATNNFTPATNNFTPATNNYTPATSNFTPGTNNFNPPINGLNPTTAFTPASIPVNGYQPIPNGPGNYNHNVGDHNCEGPQNQNQGKFCCASSYNTKHFYIASPGFPYSNNKPGDCVFNIYRANSNVCRLRIHFLFFWNGEFDQFYGCRRGKYKLYIKLHILPNILMINYLNCNQ